MTTVENLRIASHDIGAARAMADQLIALYARVYADKLADPFFSEERFAERFQAHTSRAGYALVTARIGDDLVGYAYGVPLAANSAWWSGLRKPLPAEVTRESGNRTFAVNEIMVLREWRRRGIARRLHDELLGRRPEERATLLVEQGNVPAITAYRRWGWRQIGELQPFADSPVYASMVLDLRSRSAAAGPDDPAVHPNGPAAHPGGPVPEVAAHPGGPVPEVAAHPGGPVPEA